MNPIDKMVEDLERISKQIDDLLIERNEMHDRLKFFENNWPNEIKAMNELYEKYLEEQNAKR